jgi:hypothetical protein
MTAHQVKKVACKYATKISTSERRVKGTCGRNIQRLKIKTGGV